MRISGVRGEPAPATVKVCLNYLGGYRNQMTFVLTGLDIDEKAALVERTLRRALDVNQLDVFDIDLAHTDKPNAVTNHEASAFLKVTVKSQDAQKVDRAFSSAVIEMALASYPGFFCTTPPTDATPFGVYWPTLVPADVPNHAVVLEDGSRIPIPPTRPDPDVRVDVPRPKLPDVPTGPTRSAPLGTLFGARSGDKGGNANVGVWARDRPRLRLAREVSDGRAVPAACAGNRRLGSPSLRAAELEGFELRCCRPSGRRRGFVGPIRPASQESGRIPSLADG